MDIETIINELKKQDPREAHITAPLALLHEYETDPQTAEKDVDAFLKEMQDKGLIEA